MISVTIPRRSVGRDEGATEIPTLDMSPYERLRIQENTTDKNWLESLSNTSFGMAPRQMGFSSSNNSACANRVSEILNLIIDAFFSIDDTISV